MQHYFALKAQQHIHIDSNKSLTIHMPPQASTWTTYLNIWTHKNVLESTTMNYELHPNLGMYLCNYVCSSQGYIAWNVGAKMNHFFQSFKT
jgi:hypothetical protein